METHVLGFPRIGAKRELKHALEKYWKAEIGESVLMQTSIRLKIRHWADQNAQGLSLMTVGDFSLYDQVLDTIAMLGAVPKRFKWQGDSVDLTTYFCMARGNVDANLSAMEMTKWFNTNYHYIVPEFSESLEIKLASTKILEDVKFAKGTGYRPKPVLVGPLTFLCLGKETDRCNRWSFLDDIVSVYEQQLKLLGEQCEWIQIDEPILCTDLCQEAIDAFPQVYQRLSQASGSAKLMLATYFGPLRENLELATSLDCDALHVDLVRAEEQLEEVLDHLPEETILSAGIVDGRNVWKNDLEHSIDVLKPALQKLGRERLMVSSSCSLLHSPVDLEQETELSDELKDWMAFAIQKCEEVVTIRDALCGENVDEKLAINRQAIQRRRESPLCVNQKIRQRAASVTPEMLQRNQPYAERKTIQNKHYEHPLFPTTTIGSFPQTTEIRQKRRQYQTGDLAKDEYEAFLRSEIQNAIQIQEELGLNVLVHGEPERNDMVEYFGRQLDGFCFTQNGWVQSYGSRCVKPPIIYGDVFRPKAMTVKWIRYALSLTKQPVKGMLTGPVTILCWSFVRDDLPRSEVCKQIALAIRDEVMDLEKANIRLIQIDEAALREGMPLRECDAKDYLRWAVDCFRLTASGVDDATQIHTHMCYSEFNKIIESIAEMDADVISIEASRSNMELLSAFQYFEYPNEIGPGVYDIHSPRIPTVEEIFKLLQAALKVVPAERLWVNPDCGLKTRQWPETRQALQNMVEAAKLLRKEQGVAPA